MAMRGERLQSGVVVTTIEIRPRPPLPGLASAQLPTHPSNSDMEPNTQQLPDPPAPRRTQATSLTRDGAKVPSKPSQSWETAYIFAFIFRFTPLCQDLKTGLKLRTVQDFERILETDTREIPSESTEKSDPNLSNAREILTEILILCHENLRTGNLSSWPKWLKSFVEEVVKYEAQKPTCATLKWPQNYISTRPNGFWDLDWVEKVHLLRILVDHQITHSSKIRSIIEENYEKSSTKLPKQQSTSSAPNKQDNSKSAQNQLLIKPLGLDRNLKTWWQIDDSPRIYCSGNPYKSDCTWTVLSTTEAEFTEIKSQLAVDPETIQQSDSAAKDSSSVAKKPTIPAMFTKNSRKKNQQPQDLTLQLEWKLGQALDEIALHNIEAGEQRVQQLIQEKERIEQREIRKQRKIVLAASQAPLTRATPGFGVRSRLRSQVSRPDYVVDSDEIDRQLERMLRDSERSDSGGRGRGSKRKRKGRGGDSQDSHSDGSEYQTGSLAGTNDAEDPTALDDDLEADGPAAKRGSRPRKPAANTGGERRSLRVRTKMEAEVEDEPKPAVEKEPLPQPSLWSRSKPSMSPSVSETPDEVHTNPPEKNENVSVWSRGKLMHVGANDKRLPPQQKANGENGLSTLQARLATIGGVDDNEDSFESEQPREKLPADDPTRSESTMLGMNFDSSAEPGHGPIGDDVQAGHPLRVDGSPIPSVQPSPQIIQAEPDNLLAPPCHTGPINPDDLNPHSDPSLTQHRNPTALSSIV